MEHDGERPAPYSSSELYVDVEVMRKFIANLLAVSSLTEEMPEYLQGQNKHNQSIWIAPRDLGDHEPFYAQYRQLVEWRLEEAKEFDDYLYKTAAALAWGLSQIVGEDIEISAEFTSPDLLNGAERNGMNDARDGSRTSVRGSHDMPSPIAEPSRDSSRSRPEI